jgi:AsmA family protein
VHVANTPGFSRPDMATIARLEAQIALLPLLSRRLRIERFMLTGADIALETDAQGRGNWRLGATEAAAPSAAPDRLLTLAVGAVTISESRLTYRDGSGGAPRQLTLDSVVLREPPDGGHLDIAIEGAVDAVPISFAGTTGGSAALLADAGPWPISLRATLDKLSATVDGTIAQPRSGKGLGLDITLAADKFADLGRLVGTELRADGAFKLSGHLSDADGSFVVDRLAAQLGTSDLAGRLELTAGTRPRLSATFDAARLDLGDVTGPATSSPPRRRGDRVFSAEPLPFAALKSADIALSLTARQLVVGAAILDDFAVDLALQNGLLHASKVTGTFRGGPFTTTATVDARPATPLVTLTGRLQKFDLGRFLKEMAVTDLLTGAVDLELDGHSAGGSLRQIMAGLDGKVVMVMGKAELATPLFDLIGADLVQSALPWAAHDRDTHINCAVIRFAARRGLATSEALLLDTAKVTVQGTGTVDLGSERLALVLTPQPKERSLISLATPIDVSGTLAAPTIAPNRVGLARDAAGAVIGSVIIPFGFLVPLLSGGSGDENPCVAALAKAKAPSATTRPGAASQPRTGEGGIGGALHGVGEGIRNLFGK